jgi:hypothetical protein
MVTNQPPQMKNSRNIIKLSRAFMASILALRSPLAADQISPNNRRNIT